MNRPATLVFTLGEFREIPVVSGPGFIPKGYLGLFITIDARNAVLNGATKFSVGECLEHPKYGRGVRFLSATIVRKVDDRVII